MSIVLNEKQPQDPQLPQMPPLNDKTARVKSAQTLATVGVVGGPVSLLIGGVPLSFIALICSAIAFTKLKRAMDPADKPGTVVYSLYRQAVVAMVISSVALVLNAVSLAMLLPTVLEMLENGEYGQLLGSANGLGSISTGSSSSIWG